MRCPPDGGRSRETALQGFWFFLRGAIGEAAMLKRLTIVTCVMAFGLMAGGCSKCGSWLDEWLNRTPAKTCKGDFPR
jgi:hypothetical protein